MTDDRSTSDQDPIEDNPEDLPDLFGEDPDEKKPLVADDGLNGERDTD